MMMKYLRTFMLNNGKDKEMWFEIPEELMRRNADMMAFMDCADEGFNLIQRETGKAHRALGASQSQQCITEQGDCSELDESTDSDASYYTKLCQMESDVYGVIGYMSMGDHLEKLNKKMGWRLQYCNIASKYMEQLTDNSTKMRDRYPETFARPFSERNNDDHPRSTELKSRFERWSSAQEHESSKIANYLREYCHRETWSRK
ncbi:hypothetical protein B9Z55_027956 [Caenorhabditis nigoni]|nr:hypothetical protein B9Z55_027956 [Caenorhabditis nigoni]